MAYKVIWSHNSIKQLSKLDNSLSDRITQKVEGIKSDPFSNIEKLVGFNLFKLRVGDYRVILSIDRGNLIILVVELGHRSKIYNNY
ncbi:MAG: type II toxin-antitoxin system RelE/ParE family toxin [Candidatus Parvarchaeota archaeon]|nr:type II toxin-antitoxin system RelE/ParE family toxin [Candidatus Parvarchaeota archaeon]